ncbi:MAG: pyridoxamine 5'-phosphate oxidase family protein, partial [Adlercreutzia sp.]
MRRKDREQSEEFGWSVLETCPYAVLSTTDDEGLPYGIPVSPAVLDGVIYFHSAKHGTKSKLLRKHPDV